jgi:ATP-binding cassette, subfamily C (CFTR/MRP), member 1
MRERFADHTVLAIAHKLESALDEFDLVVVLNAGKLQEVGAPRELIRRGPEVSAFAALYASLTAGKKNGDDETANGEAASRADL